MLAYKFLRSGRIGPFSRFRWPEPAIWVQADQDPETCRSGIHACRTQDLPWWLADELWEIELQGPVRVDDHKLVATAGRLRSRVADWTPAAAQEYAEACAWRARGRAVQALRLAAHAAAADELAACESLDDLLAAARQLAEDWPDTRISLTIAGDGAVRAISGATPTAAYIAAHAAMRVNGPAGYAAERAWQSQWLIRRLGLRPTRLSPPGPPFSRQLLT
jgi:hypothetical protein